MTSKLSESLKEAFQRKSFLKKLKLPQNANQVAPFRKYYGNALITGRPLGTVMIFMAGTSGSGKSSTINVLLNDPNLCKTSNSSSETKDPVILQKKLTLKGNKRKSAEIEGRLSFVDVAGTFDTSIENEAKNLAAIRKFTEFKLKSRKELREYSKEIRSRVRPNIVLFTVSATDNRLAGKDSFFRKSLEALKSLKNVVDTSNPNLIIVLTHAMNIPPKKFNSVLKSQTEIIQETVAEVFEIEDVDVIPVENKAEDWEDEEEDDDDEDDDDEEEKKMKKGYFKLPNGDLSHHNLFEAMLDRLEENEDLLGHLLVERYFDPECPERKTKATKIKPYLNLESSEVSLAGEDLRKMNISVDDKSIVPHLSFQSLGYAYCPVTEEIKPVNLLKPGKSKSTKTPQASSMKVVEINEAKFFIPECVTAFIESGSSFRKLSFYKQEDYEEHKMTSYGIHVGHELVVKAGSKGRWMRSTGGSRGSSVLSMVQEVKVANLKIENPGGHVQSKSFLSELNELPDEYDEYDDDIVAEFQGFFAKWGSHLICEQAVGGAIQLDCSVNRTSRSERKLREIEAQFSGMFRIVAGGVGGGRSRETGQASEAGISKAKFEIFGGDPPHIASAEDMDSRNYKKWAESVVRNPVELKRSMKLFPYYNLFKSGSREYKSLRKATLEYLKDTLESSVSDDYERIEYEHHSYSPQETATTPTNSSEVCITIDFPKASTKPTCAII